MGSQVDHRRHVSGSRLGVVLGGLGGEASGEVLLAAAGDRALAVSIQQVIECGFGIDVSVGLLAEAFGCRPRLRR